MTRKTKVIGGTAGAIARKVGRNLTFPTYKGPRVRAVEGAPTGIAQTAKRVSRRRQYLGSTPGKSSKQGREVIQRLRDAEPPQITTVGGKDYLLWEHPKTGVRERIPLSECDMSHVPVDAVTYWNSTGRHAGPRSPAVREWMLTSENYTLQPASYNRSEGAKLGITYMDP